MNASTIAVLILDISTFTFTLLVGLLTYIFKDFKQQILRDMQEIRESTKTNGRHLDSVIHSTWLLTWRINSIEDHLADNDDFKPPRIIGEAELRPKDD